MNILLINHYAGSPEHGMEFRPYYLAKKWVELGHDVTIFSSSFSHLRYKQPIVEASYSKVNISNIKYVFFKTSRYKGRGIGRIINIIQFLLSITKYHKKVITKNPDVIIASSTYPFDFLVSKYLTRSYKSKIIYEVHDLWPLSLTDIYGFSKYNPMIFLMQLNENYNYKNSDYVVSMLPNAKKHMEKHGLLSEKFNFIPNGYQKDIEKQNSKPSGAIYDQLNKMKKNGKKIIGYTGYHSKQNSLMCLVKAAKEASKINIHFVLIGKGPDKNLLKKYVSENNLNNVSFFPPVPKSDVINILRMFDFLYIGYADNKIYKYGIASNKLLDYLKSGKPVLFSGKTSNNIVEIADVGESVDPNSAKKIIIALNKMLNYDKERLKNIKFRSKTYLKKHHDFNILAKKFISVMSKN